MSVTSRALRFPAFSLRHLSESEAPAGSELWTLRRLEDEGHELGVLGLPAAIEDSYYRLGGLPARIKEAYRGLDPADPDEDILEEAWEALEGPLSESFLLDDVVDALFDSFAALIERAPGPAVARRQGEAGLVVKEPSRRSLLLAMKRAMRVEWTPARVAERLARTASLALDAAPVVVHLAPLGRSQAASAAASRLAGRQMDALVDAAGGVVKLEPQVTTSY